MPKMAPTWLNLGGAVGPVYSMSARSCRNYYQFTCIITDSICAHGESYNGHTVTLFRSLRLWHTVTVFLSLRLRGLIFG